MGVEVNVTSSVSCSIGGVEGGELEFSIKSSQGKPDSIALEMSLDCDGLICIEVTEEDAKAFAHGILDSFAKRSVIS